MLQLPDLEIRVGAGVKVIVGGTGVREGIGVSVGITGVDVDTGTGDDSLLSHPGSRARLNVR